MKYFVSIGLEMHCEIKTNSKVFSSAKNDYSKEPNVYVNKIDIALPGTLPTINKEAVRKSIIMASVLNCEISDELIFERKNYFYPDLPKGYQLTQETEKPIGVGGYLDIEVDDYVKRVEIDNIHLEEDTAALTHIDNHSLINFNRAGVPLLECVTTPCINSAEEAVSFLETMRKIYQFTDVSDADSRLGQVRSDVNVSLSREEGVLGNKVEIKNVNSFSGVYDAINYEIKRQAKLLDENKDDEIVQETKRWDEETMSTITMRTKEEALDYRFMVDPNLPIIKIDKNWIKEIQESIPELAEERREKYIKKLGLSEYDSGVLVSEKSISDYFEGCLAIGLEPKEAANWLTTTILGHLNKYKIEIKDFYLKPEYLKMILDNVNRNTISIKQAKEVFFKSLKESITPDDIIEKYNMKQLDNKDEIINIISTILEENNDLVDEYRAGKDKLFDHFVGQVMKATRGKANPNIVKDILNKKLSK